ncbi:hypothetical protein KSP40_PGU013989 [Platanthera guangdongensis]|uniref:Uncharacterized protein n=1 Tax=Platanthera guangdongensis TaxID=2320717 RepID=A0ABR2LQY3_9ASPA
MAARTFCLEGRHGKMVRAVSEVAERNGKLWFGFVLMPFIVVYMKTSDHESSQQTDQRAGALEEELAARKLVEEEAARISRPQQAEDHSKEAGRSLRPGAGHELGKEG